MDDLYLPATPTKRQSWDCCCNMCKDLTHYFSHTDTINCNIRCYDTASTACSIDEHILATPEAVECLCICLSQLEEVPSTVPAQLYAYTCLVVRGPEQSTSDVGYCNYILLIVCGISFYCVLTNERSISTASRPCSPWQLLLPAVDISLCPLTAVVAIALARG